MHSSGFNPHPKTQFSSALSLGVESNCELLEFFTTVKYDENELISILKKHEHKDIPISKLKRLIMLKKYHLLKILISIVYSLNYTEKEYFIFKYKRKNTIIFFLKITSFLSNKKNKQISGIYNDFIELKNLDNLKLLVKLNITKNIPNIFQICKHFLSNANCSIKKEKIYSKKDNLNELYDSIFSL